LIQDGLKAVGRKYVAVPDLCRMAVKGRERLRDLVGSAQTVVVVACYPRAVKGLFALAGIEWADDRIHVVNAREEPPERVLELVGRRLAEGDGVSGGLPCDSDQDGWESWFPVIDEELCQDCRQCLSFCLFGVYEDGEDGGVAITHPENCKNNCPACARICPHGAIIFPKSGESPLNGGPADGADLREKIKVNVDKILGDDVYEALIERRRKSKRLIDMHKLAEEERRNASGGETA